MASSLQNFGDDSVLLNVTHSNLKHHFSELRFNLHSTVSTAKERLWKNCGTAIDSMILQLFDDNDRKVCDMNDDSRPLGFYCPRDGYRIHIVDLDPSSVTAGGWLEDTSLVDKYSISEDAYAKLDGTFRKFKEKLISQDPSLNEPKITNDYLEDLARNIQVGDRCEVDPGGKRGVVMFVGRAETLAPGFWVGVQYDEPVGKHDGMVKGKRYFSCPPLHGAMLRPEKVKTGTLRRNLVGKMRVRTLWESRVGMKSKVDNTRGKVTRVPNNMIKGLWATVDDLSAISLKISGCSVTRRGYTSIVTRKVSKQ